MTYRTNTPTVPGIDLAYRPSSYFWPLDLETHLLARIKGAERRAMLKAMIDAGRTDEIPHYLAESALDDDERQAIGRWHPAFLGGEYLPDMGREEVIIARITIASVTQDVTCVYARRGKRRIHYRVVDEYEGGTLSARSRRTSLRPLTLGQLETFFNGAWPLLSVLERNFADTGYDIDQILRFVVEVDSQFYPDLDALYEHRVRVWAAKCRQQLGLDQAEGVESLTAQPDVAAVPNR